MCKLSGTFWNLECPFSQKGLNGDSDVGEKTENKKSFADTFIVCSITHNPLPPSKKKKKKK